MSIVFFATLIAVLIGATVAYPVYEALHNGGYAYYMNGLDESTYLQYDFSRLTQGPTRPGQYLVTLGHQMGLSGGWIDASYDVFSIVAIALLCRIIFRTIGWSPERASVGAALMLVLPTLVSTVNPIVAWIHNWNISSQMIYWLNVPESFQPVILRTPEPQFSLVLLAVGTLIGLRTRTFWPVYAALPFLYPFVAVPAAYVALACDLRRRFAFSKFRTIVPLGISYIAIGVVSLLYYKILMPVAIRDVLVDTRLPLLSMTSVFAFILLFSFKRWIDEKYFFFLLALALAPLAASNQQIISGHLAQPDNYEQYFGCFAVAIVAIFSFADRARWQWIALALGTLFFLRTSYVTFKSSAQTIATLPLTPALLNALKYQPERTVVDDIRLAGVLSMIYPKEKSTALGYEQSFIGMAAKTIEHYRCIKRQILIDHPNNKILLADLSLLDGAYEYGGANVPIINIFRKKDFKILWDVNAKLCKKNEIKPLLYFYSR
jgi:hypothetical protein